MTNCVGSIYIKAKESTALHAARQLIEWARVEAWASWSVVILKKPASMIECRRNANMSIDSVVHHMPFVLLVYFWWLLRTGHSRSAMH